MPNTNLPVAPILVTVTNLSNYSLGLPPPINAVIPKGQRLVIPLTDENDLNQQDIADAVNKGLISITVAETNNQGGEPALPLDLVRRGELTYNDVFADLAVSGTVITVQTGAVVAGSVLAANFSGVQVDQPRTVRVVNVGASTGMVVIHGTTATGQGGVESMSIGPAGTYEGGTPWAVITSIDFPALVGGASMSVQMSNGLGLTGLISSRTSIYKVFAATNGGTGDVTFLPTQVDPVNGTFTPAGGIKTTDTYIIRYKP